MKKTATRKLSTIQNEIVTIFESFVMYRLANQKRPWEVFLRCVLNLIEFDYIRFLR